MTTLDVKWRVLEKGGAWSFGTRAGIDLATAAAGLGFERPGAHALVMATGDLDPVLVTANAAWTWLPAMRVRRARPIGFRLRRSGR